MPIDVRGICPLIQVFDMPTSMRFYRDILGFAVVQRSQPGDDCGWALLKRNDAELMLNTQYEDHDRPPARDPLRAVAHADTSLFFRCPDVDAAYRHLRAQGVDVDPPVVSGYGMKQLSVTDPDGYGLCFQWPV